MLPQKSEEETECFWTQFRQENGESLPQPGFKTQTFRFKFVLGLDALDTSVPVSATVYNPAYDAFGALIAK